MDNFCELIFTSRKLKKFLNESGFIGKHIKSIIGYGEDFNNTELKYVDNYNKNNSNDMKIRTSIHDLMDDFVGGISFLIKAIEIRFQDDTYMVIENCWPNGVLISNNNLNLSKTINLDVQYAFKKFVGKAFTGFKIVTNRIDDQPIEDYEFKKGQFKHFVLEFEDVGLFVATSFYPVIINKKDKDYGALAYTKEDLRNIFRNKIEFPIDIAVKKEMGNKEHYEKVCSILLLKGRKKF